MATFVTPADVRAYLNVTSTTGQYSDGLIGSNINAASGNLQTWTGRQFESQGSNTAVTKVFSSDGQATIVLPGLISAAAITSQSVPLIANQTYWLMPDNLQTGVYTGLQIHTYGWQDYRSNSEWFDRNLDSWLYRGKVGAGGGSTLPNDVSVSGWWGHVPLPSPLLHATVLLAGYYTLRPDSLLTGVVQVGEGAFSSLSGIPDEVREFVHTWSLRPSVVAV